MVEEIDESDPTSEELQSALRFTSNLIINATIFVESLREVPGEIEKLTFKEINAFQDMKAHAQLLVNEIDQLVEKSKECESCNL